MSVEERILAYVVKTFPREDGKPVGATDPLLDSGLVDSVGIFDLVAFLEQEFGIKVQDEEIVPEHFESVRHVAGFVAGKQGSAQTS